MENKWFAPDWHLVCSTINKPVLGKPKCSNESHIQRLLLRIGDPSILLRSTLLRLSEGKIKHTDMDVRLPQDYSGLMNILCKEMLGECHESSWVTYLRLLLHGQSLVKCVAHANSPLFAESI